ncbi:hypothetical protein [Streptomyces sp. NBC_00268]|uniref:hypothetical protein n=1 Tax=Streptomyces sp. NBC_00268 TaxID=2975695 RepID=UPI00224E1FC3|nr:hypothetical protein [Streptomyces sp. NBC_00268]MCX5188848.1 hypothetical protein [Streptomyces sp. NBC_00268]
MFMARRGRKRRLELEAEYWRLLAAGVGSVEACRRIGGACDAVREGAQAGDDAVDHRHGRPPVQEDGFDGSALTADAGRA